MIFIPFNYIKAEIILSEECQRHKFTPNKHRVLVDDCTQILLA